MVNGRQYLTYAEAEELYGVSRPTLNRLVARGVIEAYRRGKKTMLDAVSASRWFESTKIKPRRAIGRPRKGAVRR